MTPDEIMILVHEIERANIIINICLFMLILIGFSGAFLCWRYDFGPRIKTPRDLIPYLQAKFRNFSRGGKQDAAAE